MIPIHARVAAIDDVEDHLQKIVWGLGKAGFCAIPFYFEDGKLENEPAQPLPGIRIVFSDIHLVGGGPNQEKTHAANIIRCLKKIVNGPYVLIFWSQYAVEEQDRMAKLIDERALEAGLIPPIGYAAIDKKLVFRVAPVDGEGDEFDAAKLRELILETIQRFKTLAVVASWEDRVERAAARTTNRLFELSKASDAPAEDWERLLAFLACEAVGKTQAVESLSNALDSALLPLIEDQLALIGSEPTSSSEDLANLLDVVSAEGPRQCPASISMPHLNTSYLIDETGLDARSRMWERGMVTELGAGFINSGEFVRAFGHESGALIRQEFAFKEPSAGAKLHVVELGPECDHVNGKVATHRYLLAILVPELLIGEYTEKSKKGGAVRYRNDSVFDYGQVCLRGPVDKNWHLLISSRCFMTLAAKHAVDGICRFRLRRALLEEVAHRYITHARRPGVMRW